jgi:hypothetical protein
MEVVVVLQVYVQCNISKGRKKELERGENKMDGWNRDCDQWNNFLRPVY